MDVDAYAPPRRLNGRLQACGPCHQRKVACDHGQPACRRCRDRNQVSECVYLANKPRVRRIDSLGSYSGPQLTRSPRNGAGNPGPPSPRRVPNTVSSQASPRHTRAAVGTQDTGFLGTTSYPFVFNETRDILSRLGGFHDSSYTETETPRDDCIREALRVPVIRETFLHTLRSLASVLAIDKARSWKYQDAWARTGALAVLKRLRGDYAQHLDELATDEELEVFAVFLSQNTARPFSDHLSDAREWTAQFTSAKLRWESLGLLFACCYAINDTGQVRKAAASLKDRESAHHLVGSCIRLAHHFGAANALLLRLCTWRSTNESKFSGDASLMTSKLLSDASTLLTYLGLHAETDTAYIPSYASEIRRRVTVYLFSLDKICVLFTGRPPNLSRRYMSTPPPLDLPDAVLQGDEMTRRQALKSLDTNGWNLDGKIHETTLLRARFMMSLIRDELLEIALGLEQPSVDMLLLVRCLHHKES